MSKNLLSKIKRMLTPPDPDKFSERLTGLEKKDKLNGHYIRYQIAGIFTNENSVVLDAGCANKYGEQFLEGKYIGIDKIHGQDLEIWEADFKFDTFIGLEVIEHLKNYDNFVRLAKRAKQYIIISTPIVPTTHLNYYHLHDFTEKQIRNLFVDSTWGEYAFLKQKQCGIFIFKKR